jgi:taurine dioxygenase
MYKEFRAAIEPWVERKFAPYETIAVRQLSPVIGAEIEGVDLSKELTNSQFVEVRRAFVENQVIVFRDQHLSAEDHKRFGRKFGRLHTHVLQAMRDGDDERLEVRADKGSKYVAGEDWHTDVSCDAEPPMGSMLYLTETPSIGSGGDTLFANMSLAYDVLSPAMKTFLAGLSAVHDGAITWTNAYGVRPDKAFAKSTHPVVTVHPESGRKVLFVNRGFTSHIVELARAESAAVLEMLYRVIEVNPLLTCRVRWRPNTLVFWDNRCTQHHALWDYYPLDRHGFRVSIVGEKPRAQ